MDGKKRKVMFLIYSLCGGGAERVLVETVNRLPKDRYDVTLMTLFHDDTRAGMLSPEVHYRPALRVKNGRAQKILSGIMQYIIPPKWLYRWFFKSDADVEVAFMEAFPTKILAYSTNQHAKKYAWVHIDVQTYTKQDRLFRSMRHQKACYERFDGIYCVSENVQEAFSAKFGLTERVHVAYNMLDEQAIRRRKNEPVDDIPKGEFLMVSVGSLIPRKGFERLIHVCGLLKSRGYRFHLLILGKGELYENLAMQVIDEHLQGSVQLLGFVAEPPCSRMAPAVAPTLPVISPPLTGSPVLPLFPCPPGSLLPSPHPGSTAPTITSARKRANSFFFIAFSFFLAATLAASQK